MGFNAPRLRGDKSRYAAFAAFLKTSLLVFKFIDYNKKV